MYAAVDYRRELLEPRIAAAMTEKDLTKLAEPYVAAIDIVKALGLERRRRPADGDFHRSAAPPPAGKGIAALAARAAGKEIAFKDVVEAMAEDAEAAPAAPPPANPFPRLTPTGVGLEVSYPTTFGTLVALLVALSLTPLLAVSLVSFASASMAAGFRDGISRLWPAWSGIVETLAEYPTGFLLVTLFVWWMFAGSLAYRPSRVTIEPGGVSIRRLLWPGIDLPLDVIRRVQANNLSLVFVRGDRGFWRSFVMASPNCRGAQEASWLAGEMRAALKRCGWRPPAKA